MERPALQRLLTNIREGLIDVIVVYKVDRLTRSLADFARIVELFDAHSVAFVAVTQQFNTTTSMGRLTLNVLLSFAQFEREVIGERIRDKVAASKRKGMWMGGTLPMGYDLRERKLVVNHDEARTVRHPRHSHQSDFGMLPEHRALSCRSFQPALALTHLRQIGWNGPPIARVES
jgi:DNA invertase Pin-like site-specific DNA recombinase